MKKLLSLFLAIFLFLANMPAMPAQAFNTLRRGWPVSSSHRPMRLDDTPLIAGNAPLMDIEPMGDKYKWPFDGTNIHEKQSNRLPALGWNSWNAYASSNSEVTTRAIVDSFGRLGLTELGYQYIVLDDGCYVTPRVAGGKLQPHPTRFPSGFKALSDYIKAAGLKFGMYQSVGDLCALGNNGGSGYGLGLPGYEDSDAEQYAE